MEDKIVTVAIEEDVVRNTQTAQIDPIAEQYEVSVDTPEFDSTSNDITMDEVVVGETVGDVVETVEIEIEEAVGWAGGDNTRHDSLTGRDEENQHPIQAIEGLQAILDRIETIKTVSSDKHNIANYYKWTNDNRYDTYGYFVSLVSNQTETGIKICEGSDILGVSVDAAGFVGGQNSTVPRDDSYGLIVTSGLVSVRCRSDVDIENYVVSDGYGHAKKSDSNYGYKVLGIETKDRIRYAIIMLGVQADVVNALGVEITDIDERLDAAESNIVSAINVANQAYKKSQDAATSSSVSEEAVKKALESILKSEEKIEGFEQTISNASTTSAQAKAIAESAVTSAATMKDEAVSRANDAWAKADEVQQEAYSLCAKIDQYSVGEYSQAYGLTWEQTQSILTPGMIYAPTRHTGTEYHTEVYRSEDDEAHDYERIFTPEYLYRWGYISGIQGYGWITIDKDFNVISYDSKIETNLANKSVYFTFTEPEIVAGSNFGYWYTDGDAVSGNTGIYEPYTLYKWETDHWLAVATLKGNASNRMVSEVYQTTNEIMMGVANPRGCIAALDVRLTDTEATTQEFSEWKTGEEAKMASVKTIANGDGASVVISALQKSGETVNEMASLVLNVVKDDNGNPTSALSIDASQITLNGKSTFTTPDSEDGTTKINGANIATGTIKAEQIAANAITTDHFVVDAIKSKNYPHDTSDDDGNVIGPPVENEGDIPFSTNGTFLDLANGAIYTPHFVIKTDGSAYFDGQLSATVVNAINIDASQITTGKITSEQLATNAIQSRNFTDLDGELYSLSGTFLDLNNGGLYSKNFKIDDSGNVGVRGSIESISSNGSRKVTIDDGSIEILRTSSNVPYTCTIDPYEGFQFFNNTQKMATFGLPYIGSVNLWFQTHVSSASTVFACMDGKQGTYTAYNVFGKDGYALSRSIVKNTDGSMTERGPQAPNSADTMIRFFIGKDGNDVFQQFAEFNITVNTASPVVVGSARSLKSNIEKLTDKTGVLFDNLTPRSFTYNNGDSNRTHYGLIVDELKSAMDIAGITPQECAAYCLDDINDPNGKGGIRYEELIPLLINEVQKLKSRVAELEGK